MYAGYMIKHRNYKAVSDATDEDQYVKGSLSDLIDYAHAHIGAWHNQTFSISYRNHILKLWHHDHLLLEIDLFDKSKPELKSYQINNCISWSYGNTDYHAIYKTLSTFKLTDKINTTWSYYDKKYIVDYKDKIDKLEAQEAEKRERNRIRFYKPISKAVINNKAIINYLFGSQYHVNNPETKTTIEHLLEPERLTDNYIYGSLITEYKIDLYNNFVCKVIEFSKYKEDQGIGRINRVCLVGKDCYNQLWFYEIDDHFAFARSKLQTILNALIGIRVRDQYKTIKVMTTWKNCYACKNRLGHDSKLYHYRYKRIFNFDKPRLVQFS